MSDRDEWERVRLEAHIWWCGDEVCDCHQPVVERISPNRDVGFPWIRRERLWEGTFRCGPDAEESAVQARELEEAKARFGIGPAATPTPEKQPEDET